MNNTLNTKPKHEMNLAYIDDIPHEIKDGETILSFVKRIQGQKAIPTLCDAPNLDPFGSCRVCSVDVALAKDGPVKTQASCHTPVMAGTFILSVFPIISEVRKNNIWLFLTYLPFYFLLLGGNNNW